MTPRDRLDGFVEAFDRRYRQLSSLQRVCDVEYVDRCSGGMHQIGLRTAFPAVALAEWSPSFVAREVVDGIELRENAFVAESLAGVEAVDVDGLDAAFDVVDRRGVSDLLVPVGHPALEAWLDSGVVSPGDSDSRFESAGDVDVHLYRGGEVEGVYGVPEGGVTLSQCLGEAVEPPAEVVDDYVSLNHGRRLMVYFGDGVLPSDGGFVDLVFRVVLSPPEVEGGPVELELV